MNFEYSAEEGAAQERLTAGCAAVIEPHLAAFEQGPPADAEEPLRAVLRGLGQAGFLRAAFGPGTPETGGGLLGALPLLTALGGRSPSLFAAVEASVGAAAGLLGLAGAEGAAADRRRELLAGTAVGALAVAEPQAGSDLLALETTAERVAGATGSRVVLASWSSSQNNNSRQASTICHFT